MLKGVFLSACGTIESTEGGQSNRGTTINVSLLKLMLVMMIHLTGQSFSVFDPKLLLRVFQAADAFMLCCAC